MDQQDHLERVEEGRIAALAANTVSDFVQKQRDNIISSLIGLYRAKKLSHDDAVGGIGGLVALDQLMQDLHYTQQQGEISAQEEFSYAERQ